MKKIAQIVCRSMNQSGFALPTVLIASVVMMIVLMTSVSAVASIRTSLNDQYYNQLAKEAAESGIALATMCLRLSDYTPQWNSNSDVNKRNLRPHSHCNGDLDATQSEYVLLKNNGTTGDSSVRTTFRVDAATTGAGGLVRVKVKGTAELLRTSNGAPWRTYDQTIASQTSYVDNPQLGGGAGWKERGHIGYFLAGNGALYGWGDNGAGQIGDASLGTYVSVPVKMALPTGVTRVKKIFSSGQGASVICMIGSDDQAYCRGDGTALAGTTWRELNVRATGGATLTAIDMDVNGYGGDSACVLASNAQVYCAGENTWGTLGNGQTVDNAISMEAPTRFALPTGVSAKKVMNKDYHTCVISTTDEAYCAGRNDYGQLGRGNTTINVGLGNSVPAKVGMPVTVKDIKLTYHDTSRTIHFLGTNGTVYMTGSDGHGTARNDQVTHTTFFSTPRQITTTGFVYESMISIGMEGGDHGTICTIRSDPNDAAVWCLGRNAMGQMGDGTCTNKGNFFVYSLPSGEKAQPKINTAAGYQMNATMIITQSGKVFAAGDNQYGKLGTTHPIQTCNGDAREVLMPFRPGSTTERVKAVSLSNGDEYTSYILGDDGKVYATGRNNNGQLGNGTVGDTTNTSKPLPVRIPRLGVSF